ncbi:MAG: leucine-rich repeat domain-containing protein [Lachnospiraceae bacterium]|nr:leucine-rich repeat domain-containing protein [Lachnospiraceae bacterium]
MKGRAMWKRMLAMLLSLMLVLGGTGFSGLSVYADETAETDAELIESPELQQDDAIDAATDSIADTENPDVVINDEITDGEDAVTGSEPDAEEELSAEAEADASEEDAEDALSAEGEPDDPEGEPEDDPPIIPEDINIPNVTINGISYNFVIDGIDLFGMADQDSWLVIDSGLKHDDDGRVCGLDTDDDNVASLNTGLSFDAKDTLTAFLAVVSKENDTYTLTPATNLTSSVGLEVVSFADCKENECSLYKDVPGFYRLTGTVISKSLTLTCGNTTMNVESGYSRSGWLTDGWLSTGGTPASNYISYFLGSHCVNMTYEPGAQTYYFMYRQQDYSGSCYKVCDSQGVSINSTSMPQFYLKNWDEENEEDILIPYGDEEFPDELLTVTPHEAVNMADGLYNVFRLDLDASYEPNKGQIVTFMKNGWLDNGEWKYSTYPDIFELNIECSGGLLFDYLQWVEGEDTIKGINRNDQGKPNWEKVLNIDVEHDDTVYMAYIDQDGSEKTVSANELLITDLNGTPINGDEVVVTASDKRISLDEGEPEKGYMTIRANVRGDYRIVYAPTNSSILLHVMDGRIQFFGAYDETNGLSDPIDIPRDSYTQLKNFYIRIRAKEGEKLDPGDDNTVYIGRGDENTDPWLIRFDYEDRLAECVGASIISQSEEEIIIKFSNELDGAKGDEFGMEIHARLKNNEGDTYTDNKYIHVMGKVSGLCARVSGDENIMPFKKRIDILQGDTEIELKMADESPLPPYEFQTWNIWEEEDKDSHTMVLREEKTKDISICRQNEGEFLITAPRGGDFKITLGDEEFYVGVNGIVNYTTDRSYALSNDDYWDDEHCFNPPYSRKITDGKSFFIRMRGDDYRKIKEVKFNRIETQVFGDFYSYEVVPFGNFVKIVKCDDAADDWTVYEVTVHDFFSERGEEQESVKLYFDVELEEDWNSDNPRSAKINNTYVTFTPQPVQEFVFKDWIEWKDDRITGVNPECKPDTERYMVADSCDLWLGRMTDETDENDEPVYEPVTDGSKISILPQNDAVSMESLAGECVEGASGFWRFRFDQPGEYTIQLDGAKNKIKVHVYPRVMSLQASWAGEGIVNRDSNVTYDVSDNGKKLRINLNPEGNKLYYLGLNASAYDDATNTDMSITEDIFEIDPSEWHFRIDENGTHIYEFVKKADWPATIEVGIKDSAYAFNNFRVDADIDYTHFLNDEEGNRFDFHENCGFNMERRYMTLSDGREQCGYAGSFILPEEYEEGDPWLHNHDRVWVHASSVQGVIDALDELRKNPRPMYNADGTRKKTIPSTMAETTSYIFIVVSHNGDKTLAPKEYLTLPDWVKGAFFDSGQDNYRTISDDTYHTTDTSLGTEPVYYEDSIFRVSDAAAETWELLNTPNRLVALYDGYLYAVSENSTRKADTGYDFYEMGEKLTDTPASKLYLEDDQHNIIKAGRNGDDATVERIMTRSFYEWEVDADEQGIARNLYNTDLIYDIDVSIPLHEQDLNNKYFTRVMMDPFSFPILVISADNDLTLHGLFGAQDSGENNPQLYLTRNEDEQVSSANSVKVVTVGQDGRFIPSMLIDSNSTEGTYAISCEAKTEGNINKSYLKLNVLKPVVTETTVYDSFKEAFSDDAADQIGIDPGKNATGDINNLILSTEEQGGTETGISDAIADAVMSGEELELKLEASGVAANDANYAADIAGINSGIASDVAPEDGSPEPVFVDLKLKAGIKDSNTIASSTITKLRNEMEIVLPIPRSMRNKDLSCIYVLAMHNGVLRVSMAKVDWTQNTLSFMSDRFSTFGLVGTKESKFEKDNQAVADALKNASWSLDGKKVNADAAVISYDGDEHVIGVSANDVPANVTFLVRTTGPKGGIVTKAAGTGTYHADFAGVTIGDKTYVAGKDFELPAKNPLAQGFELTIDAIDLSTYSLNWTGNCTYAYNDSLITPEVILSIPDEIAKYLTLKYQDDLEAEEPGQYVKTALVQVKEAYKDGLAKHADGQVKMPEYEEGVLWRIICDVHSKTHLVGKKDPSLTEEGYTGDLVCDICGDIVQYGKTISKLKPAQPADSGNGQPSVTPVKAGDPVSDANGTYKVTDTKEKTVTFTGNKDASGSVTVPATMKIGKDSYAVTEIAAGAFKGNTKITSVTIGANIKVIGANAFNKCSKLKSFKAKGNKITTIGDGAFQGAKNMKSIDLSKQKLTKVGKNAFSGSGATKIKLNVNSLKSIGKGALKNVGNKKKVTVTLYAKDKKTYNNAVKKFKKGKGSAKLTFKFKKKK